MAQNVLTRLLFTKLAVLGVCWSALEGELSTRLLYRRHLPDDSSDHADGHDRSRHCPVYVLWQDTCQAAPGIGTVRGPLKCSRHSEFLTALLQATPT